MTTSSGSRPISTSRTRFSPRSRPDPGVRPAPASGPAPAGATSPGGVLILGVDPGSRVTGYGFLRSGAGPIRCERSGVIAPRATLPFADRLLHIHDALAALLDELRPAEVAVETAFVRRSAAAALQIGHVRGVILLAARRSGAAIYEYTAPEVKMAVARHGAAGKDQIGAMVRRLVPGLGELREDEADAIAVALCHAHRA